MKSWFLNLSLSSKLIYSFLLAGLTPLAIVSMLAVNTSSEHLRQQALDQLDAVREIKSSAVTRYFDFVKNQINVMAGSPEIIRANKAFNRTFKEVIQDQNLSAKKIARLRNELNDYYTEQFGKTYKSENNGKEANTQDLINSISDSAIVLQHSYIYANSHPLGEKHRLDKAEGSAAYHKEHAQYHQGIRKFLEEFGYYDIFIVNPETGKIIYSVFKELDYATSLLTGPYANTNFASAFKRARDLAPGEVVIEDFKPYLPSYEAPASFAATPIQQDGATIGILIFQMPLEPINAIMDSRAGMGETGESYLVGEDHLMRSNAYLDPEHHSVITSFRNPDKGEVLTQAAQSALAGESGRSVIKNYLGDRVLSAYAPVSIGDFKWALIAEISTTEAFAGISQLRKTLIIVAILGTGAILILAATFSKMITAPILGLGNAIQRVERDGEFQAMETNHCDDEIGVTSRAFNSLLEKLSSSISETNQVLTNVSRGDLSSRVSERYPGELATLSRGVNSAITQVEEANREQENQAHIASQKAEEAAKLAQLAQQQAQDALIVKQALDVSATSVMIADENFNVIYLNQSNQKLMQDIEGQLQQHLPNFRAKDILGKNIDVFHKNPDHQRRLIEKLNSTYRTQLTLSELTVNLVTSPIHDAEGRFLGAVVEWEDVSEKLAREAEEKRIANENERIRQALDCSTNSTMIADEHFNIIYANQSLFDMMSRAEQDMQKIIPQFSANRILGSHIDSFHKDTQDRRTRQLISEVREAFDSEIQVGSRYFSLSINPVKNDTGEQIGAVVEWQDRTEEVGTEKEIDRIIRAAAAGDFSKSVDLNNKTGFLRSVAEGLNQVLNTTNLAINDLLSVFSGLASGNLNKTIEGDYEGVFAELKRDANTSMEKLRTVMDNISNSSSLIARSASEISSGNADLSRRTEEQAASLEETASSMEKMINIVHQSEENAKHVNSMTVNSVEIARQGNISVQATAKAMSEISESSAKIANIISVIDEIAFQTNLLALNAAVEAARAGEQGRGFAVVASEVRNLAQRSASAAKEIKDLIEDSVEKVEDGSRLVEESGEKLQTIVEEIEKVGRTIGEITLSAKEQNQGIEKVNKAVEQMDQMTQQNAALVEQASAASESMASQTQDMDKMIAFFRG